MKKETPPAQACNGDKTPGARSSSWTQTPTLSWGSRLPCPVNRAQRVMQTHGCLFQHELDPSLGSADDISTGKALGSHGDS